MDLDQIETFVAVVATRSFSRAAERLNTTQPNVSIRIAALERTLGRKLIERTRRQAVPTPEGRAFLAYAERIVALSRDAEAAVADPEIVAGTVRLGVSETLVHAWLPAMIREVARAFPRVGLEITVDTTLNMRDMLVARELDAGLLMGPVSEPHMLNRPLCGYAVAWVAAPSLVMPRGRLGLAELARFPIITYSRKTRPTLALLRKLQAAGAEGARIFASASLATNVRLVREGVGIAPMPAFLVREEIAARRLVKLRVTAEAEMEPLVFTATYASGSPGSLVERIVDIAVSCARADHKNLLSKRI